MESELIATKVWNELGPGFSEAVYHTAIECELRHLGVPYESEVIIPIPYKGYTVGNVRADLIIDGKHVIELKSISKLNEEARIQIKLYMKLLNLNSGILINFPTKPGPCEVEYFT